MIKYFLTILVVTTILPAQIQKSGGLQAHVDSLINSLTDVVGADDYVHPTTNELNTWGSIVDDILATNYSSAHTTAQTIDYRVIEYTDTDVNPNKVYYILHMNPSGSNYWGTFVFNPSPDRAQLIIQSPHPEYDYNTGKQGYYVFRETGARVYCLSGINRCNSSSYTTCDGTTSVCGSSEAYRISDPAHTSTGTFQRTTEKIFSNYSASIFIQLHGFAKQASDPSVIMSNGVQGDEPPTDYLSTLKDNLLIEDDTLDFKIAHIDLAWNRLLGTTNTQGRLINGSGDPCETSATVNSGQFLHLEQVKVGLRENETQWTKMSNAIAATFSTQALPVELQSFTAEVTNEEVALTWITATEINNYGFEVERRVTQDVRSELWQKIGFVPGYGTTNSPNNYSFTDPLNLGLNPNLNRIDYRLKQIDNDGTFAYSKIITVDLTTITSVEDEIEYEFALGQNYPNPFNPSTTIKFTVPSNVKRETQDVKLVIYDILGREAATLVNQKLQPGNHEVKFDASGLSSGMYFYRIDVENKFSSIKKLVLLK